MNHKNVHILLQRCASLETLKQIHARAITLALHNHQPLACKILNSYANLNKPVEAQNVFNQIQNPDVVSWTCLISLYLRNQCPTKAFSLFSQLILTGLRPDGFSVVSALSACGRNKDVFSGKIVHGMIFRFHLGSDPIVGNALIDMYCRNGEVLVANLVFREMGTKDIASWTSLLNGFVICDDLESARRLFDKMPHRNSISWTAMITGYVRGQAPIRALELFQRMRLEGNDDPPTAITIVTVLSGSADIGALNLGRCIHCYINKSNMDMDVTVNNALIDMYSKSGILEMAIKIFDGMPEKDVYSWTSMIYGYAFHGKGSHALEVFSDLLKSGLAPNEVTFVSILSACSHAGFIVQGQSLFNRMIQHYGYKPKIEHYGCMVDLLCRAGLLEEAKELIEQMHISADAVIWRSLLSACLVHKNLTLVEFAGKKIIELESDDDGVYILLWNIYRSANRWEDALKTRKMMRDRRVKKKPGCSWVEVNGVVHEFLAKDTMHHLGTEIYLVLEGITELSKLDFD